MKASVVIVCGGASARMGENKLFIQLCGKSVIERSILAFDGLDEVCEIILSTSKASMPEIQSLVSSGKFRTKIKVCLGGKTRQQSVFSGVRECCAESEIICVHDGARPLVSRETVKRCLNDAEVHIGSVVCVAVKDTIKLCEDGFAVETPQRDKLFSAQTPQAFRKREYLLAMELAENSGVDFTDDSQLFEFAGIYPFVTVGDYSNIKITTREDIAVAENYILANNL